MLISKHEAQGRKVCVDTVRSIHLSFQGGAGGGDGREEFVMFFFLLTLGGEGERSRRIC